MPRKRNALKTAPRAAVTAASAGTNAVVGAEMMRAAHEVVSARMDILAAGLSDPLRADLPEMALMGTEKVEALTLSAAALTRRLGDLGQSLARDAAEEAQAASRLITASAQATSPLSVALVQMNYSLGWWGRATTRTLSMGSALVEAQAAAMKPLHSAATANALRLGRR